MYNIVAIVGKAGSGKDTILQRVLAEAPFLQEIVSCTTRPPRENEVQGINYFFYSEDEFYKKILYSEMLEYTEFNNWYYGTSIDSLDKNKINIGVFNPDGVKNLLTKDCNLLIFWIDASDKTRLLRQLNRENEPNVKEIVRRFNTDEKDFSNIYFNTLILRNEVEEDLTNCSKEIVRQIGQHFTLGQK